MLLQRALFVLGCLSLAAAVVFAVRLVAGSADAPVIVSAVSADAPAPAASTPASSDLRAPRLTGAAIGDSVLLSAEEAIHAGFPGLAFDAVVGRGVPDGIQALRRLAGESRLGDLVLVHLGNNGEFSDAQFEEIAGIVGPERRLVVVTVRVAREWESPNNDVIARGVARHPNAVLADWHTASSGHAELLYDDGVHLRPAGVAAYARLLSGYLASR